MTVCIYSVRDELVGFGKPFVMPSDDVAVREFKKAVLAETPNDINTNKADTVLFKLGTFDDQSGAIIPDHVQLIRANEV